MTHPPQRHPGDTELALLAGGECGSMTRFLLMRHVRDCRECAAKVAQFEILRADVARAPEPDLDWKSLAAEMKANIRLGLEAGECVRVAETRRGWNPRLAVALASLTFLVFAGLTMKRGDAGSGAAAGVSASPVLESTGAGLELREGATSIMLLNRAGAAADQTVSAQGAIRARYVEGGAVTINNVYLE
jgi:hypothetical protein